MGERAISEYTVITIRSDVDRSVDEVWAVIGGFFDLDKWLDVKCVKQSGDGGLGSVRLIGDMIVEPMIAATRYSYSYMQTEGPMAPYFYHGTVACEARGEGCATITYTLVYDDSTMTLEDRISQRSRIETRFGEAVEAMKGAVQA